MKKINIVKMSFLTILMTSPNVFAEPMYTIAFPDSTYNFPRAVISPDGNNFALGLLSLKSFASALAREESVLWDGDSYISNIAYSPDGNYLFVGDYEYQGKIIDARTGKILFEIKSYTYSHRKEIKFPNTGGINCSEFWPDGSKLLTADSEGFVELWDVKTGNKVHQYDLPLDYMKYIKLSHDCKRLYVQGIGAFTTIDLDNEKIIEMISSETSSLSADVKWLLSNAGQIVHIRDVDTGEIIKEFSLRLPEFVNSLDISSNKKYSVIGGLNRNGIYSPRMILNNETGQIERTYPDTKGRSKNDPYGNDIIIRFFPDGRRYLTVNGSNVHIWDISDLYANVEGANIHK
ncbi:MAG: hypothetical protein AB1656_09470 [Candidatus Omnitrophota bacterium]